MSPELATQILALADTTPAQVGEATERLRHKAAQVRSVADARLAEERAIHDDITAKIDAASKEEAADYEAQRGEQDKLLAAARGLNEQVGRIVAFFGLPAPAAVAEAAPPEDDEDERRAAGSAGAGEEGRFPRRDAETQRTREYERERVGRIDHLRDSRADAGAYTLPLFSARLCVSASLR